MLSRHLPFLHALGTCLRKCRVRGTKLLIPFVTSELYPISSGRRARAQSKLGDWAVADAAPKQTKAQSDKKMRLAEMPICSRRPAAFRVASKLWRSRRSRQ